MRQESLALISAFARFSEILHSLPHWDGLSPELAVEWPDCRLVVFEVRPSSPHAPVVDITSSVEPSVADSVKRGCGDVGSLRVLAGEDFGNGLLEQNAVVSDIVASGPAPALDPLEYFIVAGPQNQTGVVPGSLNLLPNLDLDILEEVGGGGVDAIAEHEVVEDHDAQTRRLLQQLV